MKKIITIISFSLILISSYADIGYCFKYKVVFELKDNTLQTGFYLFTTYDEFFKNITSFDTIVQINKTYERHSDSITIIEKIETFDSLRIGNKYYSFDAVSKNYITRLCLNDIKSYEIVQCTPCWNQTLSEDIAYPFVNNTIPVIRELTEIEIRKLKANKPYISFVFNNCPDNIGSTIAVLSYNKELDKNQILSMLEKEYCKAIANTPDKYVKKYRDFKTKTRKDNLIIIRYYW